MVGLPRGHVSQFLCSSRCSTPLHLVPSRRPRPHAHSGVLERIRPYCRRIHRRRSFLLAKVGVERSNRFTRSSFPTTRKPRNSAAFVFFPTVEIVPAATAPGGRGYRAVTSSAKRGGVKSRCRGNSAEWARIPAGMRPQISRTDGGPRFPKADIASAQWLRVSLYLAGSGTAKPW
jgi:hypothetical protein